MRASQAVPSPAPASSAEAAAARARLVLECTRAVFRAQDESALGSALSQLLTESGEYSSVSLTVIPAREGAPVLTAPDIQASAPDVLMLPIVVDGRAVSVLMVRTRDRRMPDSVEIELLQGLAGDVAYAIGRLHAQALLGTIAASERRLRETFEHAGVGITRIDMNGHFIEVNQKFCEMLGYSRDELIGRATRDVTVPSDYGPGVAFRAMAQLGQATVSIAEKRYVRNDGTHVWVRRTMSPAYDENSAVRDVISVVEDITERKNAQETVAHERTLLRTIIDAVPHYVYVKDAEGRFTLANKAWLQGRGLTIEQVQGKTVRDIFPPALAAHMEAQDAPVLAEGAQLLDVEQLLALPGPDSSKPVTRWSLTTKVPLRDAAGAIIGMMGLSGDITERKRIEKELRAYVERFELAARATSDVLWDWDLTENTLWWGDGLEKLFQYRRDEIGPTIESWTSRVHPAESAEVVAGIHRAIDEGETFWSADYRFRRADGTYADVYDRAYIARDAEGRATRMLGAMMDISQRKQAEDSLQESEQQLRAMFDNAEVGIAVTGLDLEYLRVNDKYCTIVGYKREELLRMRVPDVNLEENVSLLVEYREQMLLEGQTNRTREKQLVRKDGSLIWVSMATSLVRGADGTPRYYIAVIQDISESKRAAAALKESEEQFRQLAHYDSLTRLPNRSLFYDRLAHDLAHARRQKWVLAVLFIDVDRFKHVNDTFGHIAGDQLLKQVSERLSECVRSGDTVGRLSGDEFAIVLSHLTLPEDAATVAQKIVDVLNQPFVLEGAELFVTASIGITVFPTDSTEQDTLIRNADVAMYRAKERGRNNYQFYTPEMNRRTREMLSMEGELRRALERDEFVLHYQPKVSLASGCITGVEALLRWRHPERGLIPPGDFIPLLEETGLIVQAGEWVLRAVCAQLKAWERAGIAPVPVAVNLSARQFLAPDLAETIRRVLEENQVRAELVEVEITESAIMTDTAEAIRTLEYLQSLGVHTAIDDFGTGYSSLGYLKRFPLRALKIDRSFVRDITTDPDDATITQAVISMAHSLNLKVIAEGVETEAQLEFLQRYGCDEVQGYLYSRPIPGDECGAMIAHGHPEKQAEG